MGTAAAILGIVSLIGTLVGVWSNNKNNEFIDKTNQENREFQEQTNLQNHQWSLEAAEWEYEHEKPQRQYADLLAAGMTPAAAAQQITGANVSYSPATAVAPKNTPMSTNILNDSLQQVIGEIGDYSSMAQAQASAEKTKAETKVITETSVKKANAEIDKILADTFLSYAQTNVADSQSTLNQANTGLAEANTGLAQANTGLVEANTGLAQANTDLINEKVDTEQVNRRGIELTNKEKEIQLEFTRDTLSRSVEKTRAEIKYLSEQTAKLKDEVTSIDFDNKYKEWRNTYIETYGVPPEEGWEDILFKAVIDGKAEPMLDSLTKSLSLIFDPDTIDGFIGKNFSKRFPGLYRFYQLDQQFREEFRKGFFPKW